jgi:predicted metal-dependent hydrolase
MQKRHANQKKTFSFEYEFEDMIWLFIKNIKIERSFRKLNHKWIESYKIKKVLKDVCQLDLSSSMKIHDTFHISLLRKTTIDFLIEQIQSSSSSIMINEDKKKKYEINDIFNSRYHYDKLQYRIVWIDHFSNKAWYSAENFSNHSKNILIEYHQKYSNKSKSKLRLIASITSMIDPFYWLQQAKNLVKDTLNKMQAKMKKDDRKEFNKDSFVTKILMRKEIWISVY